MTKNSFPAFLATAAIFLAAAAQVSAHVVVQPGQVVTGSSQVFSVFVPTERDVPTTSVRLVIAAGVSGVEPLVKPGWNISTVQTGEGEDAVISEITWSGGEVPVDLKDQFQFTAKVDGSTKTLIWKAYQTYQDGTVVAWDQEPGQPAPAGQDESTPYSQTLVVTPADPNAASNEIDYGVGINVIIAVIVSVMAMAFSLIALYQSGKKRK